VVVLLFILMVINFADKAVVGIAAVPIMQELQLGPHQYRRDIYPGASF
jgi:MFS transporter, ACS family, D-galactonate transporter